MHPFLCKKILAALGDDPEDDYAPVYCRMLGDIDASDWTDVTQINALIADTDDIVDVSPNFVVQNSRVHISLKYFCNMSSKIYLHFDICHK